MLKSFLVGILMSASAMCVAQTTSPVANDISMSIYNGLNNTLRYVDTDKTGRLQFIMYGQDPTTGNPQLRPQRRVFGPSIVCGSAVDSTCDVVASAVSIYAAQIVDSTTTGRAVLLATDQMAARMAIGAGTSSFDGAYASLSGVPLTFSPTPHTQAFSTITSTPTTLAGYGITDGFTVAQARAGLSLTTTGTGAATYSTTTGVINVPTPASAAAFNFGQPVAKTIAASIAYQAVDATKAAIVTIIPACTNTTSLVAASACTMQVRQSAAAGLTCSTGTVVSTWSSTIALGLVITQGNSFPIDVKLPIGGFFVVCPSAGTFTLSATEQSAG